MFYVLQTNISSHFNNFLVKKKNHLTKKIHQTHIELAIWVIHHKDTKREEGNWSQGLRRHPTFTRPVGRTRPAGEDTAEAGWAEMGSSLTETVSCAKHSSVGPVHGSHLEVRETPENTPRSVT